MSRLGNWLDGLAACPGCGCGGAQRREDCGCMRHDCECSRYGGFQGPDTDYDDTYDYQHPTGPSEPVSGKWWLRGKCSTACADVNCPPNGACQREELFKADRLPPASFPWLNGPPPEDHAMPAAADQPDVKVHHTQGCELCGSRDEHTHTQADWRALIDSAGDRSGARLDPPPAAEPYQPPADTPDPVDEAERIVRRAEEIDAYHNGSTPPGRTIHGPDGTTPIGTYQTVDNGDGTTVMQRMTLNGWRELPETRANNGRPPAKPKQHQTTTSGGTVASIEEVKAGIGQANDTASNSLGGLQQAHSDIEQASGMLQQAAQGSSQADADEATGLFQRAIELITEVQQTVSMAIQSAEGVAARL